MAARCDWEVVRAGYEAGEDAAALALRHGLTPAGLLRRAKRDGWMRPAEVSAAGADEEMRLSGGPSRQGQDAAAAVGDPVPEPGDRAAVTRRHRREWEMQRELSDRAAREEDMELAKLAKLIAETLKIRQESERRAWGIADRAETEVSGGLVVTWAK